MQNAPQMLTLMASAPVSLKIDIDPTGLSAVGVNLVCEMNQQRWTCDQAKEMPAFSEFLQQPRQMEICSLALYPAPPLEAVEIQPFSRPIQGQHCFFSQQGVLPDIHNRELYAIGQHWPVSCSDQERAFCVLLERVLTLWQEGRPDQESRLALMADYAARLDRLGGHNFKYWDGELLYAYSSQDQQIAELSFCQLKGREFEFGGTLGFTVTADEDIDLVIVGDKPLISHDQVRSISSGSVVCFNAGKMFDSCEPVSFWIPE